MGGEGGLVGTLVKKASPFQRFDQVIHSEQEDSTFTRAWVSRILHGMSRNVLCALTLASLSAGCASSIWTAARKGDAQTVQDLLQQSPELLEAKAPTSLTPLHEAARAGRLQVVQLLLKKGAALDVQALGGVTPLYFASYGGHTPVVKALLDAGAKLNERSAWDPLRAAASRGHVATIKLLLERGADVQGTGRVAPLFEAAAEGHVDVMELLVAKGAKVNRVTLLGFRSALSVAAESGRAGAVRWLIEKEADVDQRDSEDRTPLYLAAQNGHLDVVRALLKGKADAMLKASDGSRPLDAARRADHREIVKLLGRK